MSRFYFRHVAGLSAEPLELYWLAGFRRSEENQWFVTAAVRECASGRLLRTAFPIGALPILALGRTFTRGGLDSDPCRGEAGSALISNLSDMRVATSAELDQSHYSFAGRPGGVQRLFEYRTRDCRLLVPAVELIRYLFVHNRVLAQAIMRPSGLNLLFAAQAPSISTVKRIDFTRDMPKRCLTRPFVREFAWLALDPDARQSWDSVARLSTGMDHVLFCPPPLENVQCGFRGVRLGNTWLVLEILSLSGRILPCSVIEYRHPGMVGTIRIKCEPGSRKEDVRDGLKTKSLKDVESELEVEEGNSCPSATRNVTTVNGIRKDPRFENPVLVKAIPSRIREQADSPRPMGIKPGGGRYSFGGGAPARVSAGEPGAVGFLPPIEFTSLPIAVNVRLGTLEALYDVANEMRELAPSLQITATPLFLKEGRAFSLAGQDRRLALAIFIQRVAAPLIVLVDVERTGVSALSLMALRFRDASVAVATVEDALGTVLDGLVDQGGAWSSSAEKRIGNFCDCERLPKALCPRQGSGFSARDWAERLMQRLFLP